MIKVVLFDVGGTLISPRPSVGDIYGEIVFQHQKIKIDPKELNQRFKLAWLSRKGRKESINRGWWKNLVKDIFDIYSITNFDQFFDTLYKEFSKPVRWAILPDVKETLVQLKQKGLQLGLASNWDERLPPLLKDLQLWDPFTYHFISFQVGSTKPSSHFFSHIKKVLPFDPSHILFIGDSPDNDFKAGQSAGFNVYLIDRSKQQRGENHLSDLKQIMEII